MHKNIRKYTSN